MSIIIKKGKSTHARVFVAMSGGVDSSVAAALLQEQGFEVVGVFMKFWTAPQNIADISLNGAENDFRDNPRDICVNPRIENKCCSAEAYRDALAVADKLGIKLYTFNFEKEFKKRVVDYFIESLKAGDTPNPCVVCNKEIKFKLLLEKILKLGGDYAATGHYARKIPNSNPPAGGQILNKSKILNPKFKTHKYKLLKARDITKDQSYFLWAIKQRQLARFLFPIGDYTKERVRKIAKDFGLPVFEKRDSQDLCFVGDHLDEFIDKYVKPRRGDIVDIKSNILGKHNDLAFYTIGQRKNIGLAGGPWYVYKKDTMKNRLIVVGRQDKDLLFSGRLAIKDVNWISGDAPKETMEITAKIRYQHKSAKAILTMVKNRYILKFLKPQAAITPGQSAVFYRGDELLGGGIIDIVF